MIKRHYFIAGEIQTGDGVEIKFYRYFWVASLFANPLQALKRNMASIAESYGADDMDIIITAFTRC